MRVAAGFILFSSSLLSFGQTGPDPPPMPGKLVDVGGYRVHLYCTGDGSPAVVVATGDFSTDWALVQPQIARLTRICTYDPAGMAWSDPWPHKTKPTCGDRVAELHTLLQNAGVGESRILVGFSIGGLVARLYAARYPAEVAGVVLVDHAFIDTGADAANVGQPFKAEGLDSPPVLIAKEPIALDLQDDDNFARLPERNQQLHRWALSVSTSRPTSEMAAGCFSEVEEAEQKTPFPLGAKPVAVVSTLYDSPRYRELQRHLLALSRASQQLVAQHSTHMVILDEPEVVVQAINSVIAALSRQ